jgi:hypothetical protein
MPIRFLLSAMIFSLALNASANSPSFDRVDAMFNAGVTFDFGTKLGWYSGRCWSPTSDAPVGSVVILDQRGLAGPAFPADRKFVIFTASYGSADRYDNMSPLDRASIQNTFNQYWGSVLPLEDTTGFSIRYESVVHQLRQTADGVYLVGKASNSVSGVTLSCYFFKQVNL